MGLKLQFETKSISFTNMYFLYIFFEFCVYLFLYIFFVYIFCILIAAWYGCGRQVLAHDEMHIPL